MVQVHEAVVEDDIPASVDSLVVVDGPAVVDGPVVDSDVSVVWADVDVVFAVHLHGAAVEVVDDEPVQVDVNFVEVEVEVTVVALHLPASEILERFIFNLKSSIVCLKKYVCVQHNRHTCKKICLLAQPLDERDLAEWLERLTAISEVATVLGSIPASSDIIL